MRLLFRSRFDITLLLSLRYYSSIYNLINELNIKLIILDLDKRVAFKKKISILYLFSLSIIIINSNK